MNAKIDKSEDDYFCDWESHVFGFGYGTGEPHTISALRGFLCNLDGDSYNYEIIEHALTPTVAWLLINTLCGAGVFEYGTSPRFSWLTAPGRRLRDYVVGKSVENLLGVLDVDPETHVYCSPISCNCGPDGYEEGLVCQNPFWVHQ